MRIKESEGRQKDIDALKQLLQHPAATGDTKMQIDREIRLIHAGVCAEKEAAYELDFHYGKSKNSVLIHDLRLCVDGRVAQIDHLLISRLLDCVVLETKRFGEGIEVNQYGECSAFFGGSPYGIPSPFEQNKRHCAVLRDAFSSGMVKIPSRIGVQLTPTLKSKVVVSKNARIIRSERAAVEQQDILKIDQFATVMDRELDAAGFVESVSMLAKVISSETLHNLGEQLVALHTPIEIDWAARFGLDGSAKATAQQAGAEPVRSSTSSSRYWCSGRGCGKGVSEAVAKFCWNNRPRFGGKVYCMDCQKAH